MYIYKETCIFMLINAVLLTQCDCTLTPNTPKRPKEKKIKPEKVRLGPQNYSVQDEGLVSEKVTAKDILTNYKAFLPIQMNIISMGLFWDM